jgi:hypothetical protein
MNQEEIFIKIRTWEIYNGENFLDYFNSQITEEYVDNFVKWLNDKKYISNEKLNLFKLEGNYILQDILCGCETEYSLFPNGDGDPIAMNKSISIFSEFLFSNKNLIQEFNDFIYGKGWSCIKTEKEIKSYTENFDKELIEQKNSILDEYKEVLEISVDELNKILDEYN